MVIAEDRRTVLIEAHQLALVTPGEDAATAARTADAAAAHLLEFMRQRGDFALGMLQAASYLLSGESQEYNETRLLAAQLTERALSAAPNNPDILRRAYTIFARLSPDASYSEADVFLTDANWETLPQMELLR